MRPEGGAAPNALVSAVRWAACAGVSVPLVGQAMLRGSFGPGRREGFKLLDRWSKVQRRIFGIDLSVEDHNRGRYPSPPYIFVVLNQTSHSEIFILPSALPTPNFLVMNVEFALVPTAWPLWLADGIVIVRQWPRHAQSRLERAKALLREGRSTTISIEGKRSRDGSLSPFKKGPVVMALETGATLVPVVIHGARDRLPYGQWRVRPGNVRVVVGESISTRGLTYADRDDLVARLRALAERELGEACERSELSVAVD